MRELDPLISEYAHEKQLPREGEALFTLRKIASLVKPIMRARSWRVGTLAEFYPAETNLLGLNVNRGQKILLRLRYPGDVKQFLPLEQVVDTMLHELSHNVFGAHDDEFHALWHQLREEHEGLARKGYTGEGFLSEGRHLGGKRIPKHEARRLARLAAETRRDLSAGSGQRLGGAPIRADADIRKVIVDAIERRAKITKGCASGTKDEKEIKAITDEASKNGFTTKAEEDEANDAAIAQALWELVQEDEKAKYGNEYMPPSATNPTGNGGGGSGTTGQNPRSAPPSQAVKPNPTRPNPTRPMSRLVYEQPSSTKPLTSAATSNLTLSSSSSSSRPSTTTQKMWICPLCTCHNPMSYLSCDACTSERIDLAFLELIESPLASTPPPSTRARSRPSLAGNTASTTTRNKDIWTCHMCSTVMDNQWWTCSTCGTMKLSS